MDVSGGAVLATFSLLITSFIGLFGWTLSQASKLSGNDAAMSEMLKGLSARIDVLVAKLDANFSIQINEQVARNVLQEKVGSLERQVVVIERRQQQLRGRAGFQDRPPEEMPP